LIGIIVKKHLAISKTRSIFDPTIKNNYNEKSKSETPKQQSRNNV